MMTPDPQRPCPQQEQQQVLLAVPTVVSNTTTTTTITNTNTNVGTFVTSLDVIDGLLLYDDTDIDEMYTDLEPAAIHPLLNQHQHQQQQCSITTTTNTTTTTTTNNNNIISIEMIRYHVLQALSCTIPEWEQISNSSSCCCCDDDDSIINTNNNNNNVDSSITTTAIVKNTYIDHITSLLLIRIVAILLHRQYQQQQYLNQNQNMTTTTTSTTTSTSTTTTTFDYSTTTICRQTLIEIDSYNECNVNYYTTTNNNTLVREKEQETQQQYCSCNQSNHRNILQNGWVYITNDIIQQVQQYVTMILHNYSPLDSSINHHNNTLIPPFPATCTNRTVTTVTSTTTSTTQTTPILPYHNIHHAYAVVLNCNKLIDLLLVVSTNNTNIKKITSTTTTGKQPNTKTATTTTAVTTTTSPTITTTTTYGLRNDPLLLFALLFAALIHDVQHEGKSNVQIANLNNNYNKNSNDNNNNNHHHYHHPAALVYNDVSIQEQRSLYVAFTELLKSDYTALRTILFQSTVTPTTTTTSTSTSTNKNNNNQYYSYDIEQYRYFRTTVIAAVLSTDLSSPTQMAVTRSKWKEAFFINNHQNNLKTNTTTNIIKNNCNQNTSNILKQQQKNQNEEVLEKEESIDDNIMTDTVPRYNISRQHQQRRSSAISNISNPRIRRVNSGNSQQHMYPNHSRRGSMHSEMSEITTDEQFYTSSSNNNRRNSLTYGRRGSLSKGTPPRQQIQYVVNGHQRRSSIQSDLSYDDDHDNINTNIDDVSSSGTNTTLSDGIIFESSKSPIQLKSPYRIGQRSNSFKNSSHHNHTSSSKMTDEYSDFDDYDESNVSDTIDSYVIQKRNVARKLVSEQQQQQHPPPIATASVVCINNSDDIQNNDTFVDTVSTRKSHPSPTISITAGDSRTECVPSSSVVRKLSIKSSATTTDGSGGTSFQSYPANSLVVGHKRIIGGPKTRRRSTSHVQEQSSSDRPRSKSYDSNNDDDAYYSVTPPSSDDDSTVIDEKYQKSRKELYLSSPPLIRLESNNKNIVNTKKNRRVISRRASTGAISRFGSIADQRIDENHSNHDESNHPYCIHEVINKETIQQSKSLEYTDYDYNNDIHEPPKYRKRLGIRRSMDLSGEAIEFYPRRSSIDNLVTKTDHSEHGQNNTDNVSLLLNDDLQKYNNMNTNNDEPDNMKASAVIEALLRMADVGHYYQTWETMTEWSERMFQERMMSETDKSKRNEIYINWFDNQIVIIDDYLKPLAVQLYESNIFDETIGMMLMQNIEEIRRQWMIHGYEWCQKLVPKTKKIVN